MQKWGTEKVEHTFSVDSNLDACWEKLGQMISARTVSLFIFAFAIVYAALKYWRWEKNPSSEDGLDGFRPRMGFTRLDGMESVSLLLENDSKTNVWVEEIEIAIAGLVANEQTHEPSCREVLRIRQLVGVGDLLPISVAGVIYKAAGEPQREYSCSLSSILRFRIGKKEYERNLEDCRIEMIGLIASGLRRDRKRSSRIHAREEAPAIATVGAKLK